MRFLRGVRILGIVGIMGAGISAAQADSLPEALEKVYLNHPALQEERMRLFSEDESASQAFSGWLPSVSASVEQGRKSIEISRDSTESNVAERAVSLSQPIFQGGETVASQRKADQLIYAAREKVRSVEQSVLLEGVEAYMAVVRDKQIIDLNKKEEETLKEHLDETKERFALGEVTKTDVAQAEARLALAVAERIQAEASFESSKASYVRTVGEDAAAVEMPEFPVRFEAGLADMLEMAESRHPDILYARYEEVAAKEEIKKQKSSLLPDVTLDASQSVSMSGFAGSTTTQDYKTGQVAFNVSVPLYQSGSEYSQIREAKHEANEKRYALEDEEKRIKAAVISAYQEHRAAKAAVASYKAAVEAATTAKEGVARESQQGLRTTLDVLDAEQELFKSEVNLVQGLTDEVIKAYTLLAQIGRLNASELQLRVPLFDADKHYNDTRHQIVGF